jgi:hypothetical protein
MNGEQFSMHCQGARPKMRRDRVNVAPTRLEEKRHGGAGQLPKSDFTLKLKKAVEILDCTSRWRYSHPGVDA